ncbi:hypothetical protein Gogos_020231 [Gossypium gossypioides]|uniref:Uncharacterized protein n=1 Tax=Gossypium gossypioides TaxID=34282 RepID=A0A7J9CZ90_GOSGO|nr:hypothetical protein [Gossypium gossypioides]
MLLRFHRRISRRYPAGHGEKGRFF